MAVAILLPEPWRFEVEGLRRALGDPGRERVTPHVTLAPPVNVAVARLGEVLAALRRAAAEVSPFELALGPLSTFWPDSPVLYLAASAPDEALARLRQALRQPPLAGKGDRAFVPHVTVGNRATPAVITAALASLTGFSAKAPVDRAYLLRHQPDRRWVPLADALFGGRAVIGRGGLELEVSQAGMADPEVVAFLVGLGAEGARWGRALSGAGAGAGLASLAPGPPQLVVVGRRQGEVVGVATGSMAGSRAAALVPSGPAVAVLAGLTVAPGARRQGVGRHLLAALEHRAAGQGASAVVVPPAGPELEGLLAAAGYRRHPPGAQTWERSLPW